jgi:Secretion system C-terminal sorting domain
MKVICTRATILSIFTFFVLGLQAQGLWSAHLTEFKADSRNGNVNLSWKTESEENLRQFEVEYSPDGNYYQNLGFIPARNKLNGSWYEFEHAISYTDSGYYRLKMVDATGKWVYSEAVLYHANKISAFAIYPNVITTGVMNIFIKDPFDWLQVVSMNGAVMLKQNLGGKTGRLNIPLSSSLSSGTYVVQLGNHEQTITQKVIIQ